MGFEYQMRMVCDRCGDEIEPWTKAGSLEKLKCNVKWAWQHKHKHKNTGVMLGLPNRYGKYSIFCQPCADGNGPILAQQNIVSGTTKTKS